MEIQQPQYIEEDEITLKELILKIKEFWGVLWQQKVWIIIVALLFAGFFALKTWIKPITFTAPLTFMVNEDEGNQMGAISGILGQFGLPGGGNSEFNLDRILELAKSRRIVYPCLLEKANMDGQDDIIANHLIRIYDYHKKWSKSKNQELHKYQFTKSSFEDLDRTGQIALKSLHTKVVGNEKKSNDPLLSTQYGEETGILKLTITSEDGDLSSILVNKIYERLSSYYIEKTIEPQQETVKILKEKTDSLRQALNEAEASLASFDATRRSLWSETEQFKRDARQRKVTLLTLMYGEALKNSETAQFALQSKTPFFQVIDPPPIPLAPNVNSKFRALVIGGVLGGFLAVFWFIARKIYRDTMSV